MQKTTKVPISKLKWSIKMFKTKEDAANWALDQFNKYGIRQPDSFTEEEIADACPEVPRAVIKRHVQKRDSK